MRRFALLPMMIALISITVVLAQGHVEFLERMREAFFFVDVNKDGFLTMGEYQRIQGAAPGRFARVDRNNDGTLSIDEFLKAVTEDFDAADKNDDGLLDDEEVKAWIAH
jgi:Ca2+-binding EF-hand superfamily protein